MQRDRTDCRGYEIIEPHPNPWLSVHQCNLEALHFGRHVCWCGWAFGPIDAGYMQAKLPFKEFNWGTE